MTATKARLTQLEPARVDISHVRSLCVLPFSGPSEHGAAAQSAIAARLQDSGVLQLVDVVELQALTLAPLGAADRTAALEAARRRGVDTILVGQVRLQEEGSTSLGPVNFRIGEPALASAIAFEVIDVRSGQTLVRELVRKSFEPDGSGQTISSSVRDKIFRRLTAEAADEVAYALAPHSREIEVTLAAPGMIGAGAGTARIGNQLAHDGDWSAAMAAWNQALEENPEHPTACYNLGLAYEAQGDYEKARELYTSASERQDKELYRQAIERTKKASFQRQLAWNQIEAFRRSPGTYAPAPPATARQREFQGDAGYAHHSYPDTQAPGVPVAGYAIYGPYTASPALAPDGAAPHRVTGWSAPVGAAPGYDGAVGPPRPWPTDAVPAYQTASPYPAPPANDR
jgi:tetratricopeptide (TPR) repeat protein